MYASRLRALFDSLPALMAYWDGDLRNAVANAALLKWYGLTPEQVDGMHIRDVLGPELYEKDLPSIEAALRGKEQVLERDLIDAAGAIRHTQTTYLPDKIAGESPGFFAIDADITPWVEATRAMDEAQHLTRLGSWVHDYRSDIIVWTDELYRIFGEDPETFTPTAETIADRVHPEDIDRLRAAQDQARTTGEGYDCSFRIVLSNGALREVRGRERPQEGGGEILRLIGTVQDMTEINAAARELARLNSELARINQVNADVLAMVGHDVRAPLAVMLGHLEALVEDWETTTDAARLERTRRIQRATQRLEVLVEDILAMAAADAGELTPDLTDVRVVDAVRDALSAISADDAVQVSVGAGLSVHADVFHLRQIVTNLVTNALRYGEPPVEVTAVHDAGGTVTLRVRDQGLGVSHAAVAGLFERFHKSATSKSGVTGGPASGFGLYMAARMATLNHGQLVYEPAESGACFALTLPGSVAEG
jgi:PAS domain S-box-containing protein